jgi:DNA-binding LacI/PurR family transcriptional regulator
MQTFASIGAEGAVAERLAVTRLKDVAERAGVSVGTVSKVLNGAAASDGFSAACVRRVRRAARELDYRPNYLARGLQTGRSHALGMLLGANLAPESAGRFWLQLVGGVMDHARNASYQFVTVGPEQGASPMDVGLQFLRERRIDALIVPVFAWSLSIPEEARGTGLPIVLASHPDESSLPVVDLDDEVGIHAAVEHLAALGHQDLLWVGPRSGRHPSVQRRRQAFRQTIAASGLMGDELLIERAYGSDYGSLQEQIAAAREALIAHARSGARFTGIVCYEESTALGAYAAASELGLQIPGDVSIIGFDDIYACVAWPPMTVVSHMLYQIGQRAAQVACDLAEGGAEPASQRILVPAELVVRQSTGPSPAQDGRGPVRQSTNSSGGQTCTGS